MRLEKLRMIRRNLLQINHKVVEMLDWLLRTFGRDRSNPKTKNYGYRLQRIHFHCLTYQLMVSAGTDWSNLAAGLAASARVAGRLSCSLGNQARLETDLLEVRTAPSFIIDKKIGKMYNFNPHRLDQTLYCQPAIFVSSMAALEKFKVENPDSVDKITHVAGFSVVIQYFTKKKWAQVGSLEQCYYKLARRHMLTMSTIHADDSINLCLIRLHNSA
uniref:DDE_Tnp_1_7 domain-containing protein n=1 Tax=Heterorhabditis bacteriophora TaxID=37862 RepID=A0A1I7WRI1_HETBA